jgi:hypothetical protein
LSRRGRQQCVERVPWQVEVREIEQIVEAGARVH